ncbi:MAG: response regulator [Planctomycetota bacterium]|nr:DNA-binding response regulator [Planctomycetota bacterium]MEE2882114.1 response regulator [Planctomycetota bacterium]
MVNQKERVLLVEDEGDIRDVIEYNLEREGYLTLAFDNGEAGLEAIRNESPDLVLLDLMLPGIDGLEICRQIKEDPTTRDIPIIMITAKTEESDVVLGLGVGADDYVNKPFSPQELIARVKSVLRRAPLKQTLEDKSLINRHGLVIDRSRHKVTSAGEQITLTATEFRLLHFFASHPGRVFSRDHLLSRVIGDDAVVIDRNIDVHVRSIRKKMGALRGLIETVRGVGYRFKD